MTWWAWALFGATWCVISVLFVCFWKLDFRAPDVEPEDLRGERSEFPEMTEATGGVEARPVPLNRAQKRQLMRRFRREGGEPPRQEMMVCPICSGKQYITPEEQVKFRFFHRLFANVSCPACNADGKGY